MRALLAGIAVVLVPVVVSPLLAAVQLVIVSPRETRVLSSQLKFVWTGGPETGKYSVHVLGPNGMRWTADDARTGMPYPDSAPKLVPGVRYRWEVRMTPDEVSKAISRYGTVGQVRDIVPKRFGVSGRVIEASVVGSDGELILDGLRVRWGLGLRENLFVIDRERDAAGNVTRFVFTGKGWGHGVGLCQVGSFGMAQAGSTFDRILQHYYTGISLRKEY